MTYPVRTVVIFNPPLEPYGAGFTSEALRKILVAGAAVAALSVVANRPRVDDGVKVLTDDTNPA